MTKQELIEQAHELRHRCIFMLENAPQSMANVMPILSLLHEVNKLIFYLEDN